MKSLFFVSVILVLFHASLGILRVGDVIPSNWGSNYRYYDKVKDVDDCRFGYRVSRPTNQVINVLNCTFATHADVFYVLELQTCATSSHALNGETCFFTPDHSEENDDFVQNDPDCRAVRLGVTPSSTNCCQFKYCNNDGISRVGTRMCARGQFFSNETFRCEHMWRDVGDGRIQSLTDQFMCGTRPLPVDRKRNYGLIMQRCVWFWDFQNANTYSVAEPLNCQIRYLCSRYNPASVDSSYIFRCDSDLYWSNSQQKCVLVTELSVGERNECSI